MMILTNVWCFGQILISRGANLKAENANGYFSNSSFDLLENLL